MPNNVPLATIPPPTTYYPDLYSGTCVNGFDYPAWMDSDVVTRRMYLYDTDEGCCTFWFGEAQLSDCLAVIIARTATTAVPNTGTSATTTVAPGKLCIFWNHFMYHTWWKFNSDNIHLKCQCHPPRPRAMASSPGCWYLGCLAFGSFQWSHQEGTAGLACASDGDFSPWIHAWLLGHLQGGRCTRILWFRGSSQSVGLHKGDRQGCQHIVLHIQLLRNQNLLHTMVVVSPPLIPGAALPVIFWCEWDQNIRTKTKACRFMLYFYVTNQFITWRPIFDSFFLRSRMVKIPSYWHHKFKTSELTAHPFICSLELSCLKILKMHLHIQT